MKIFIAKSVLVSLVSVLGTAMFFISAEPVMIGAVTASSTSVITLNVTSGISVSGGNNATMSQSVGAAANTAVATTTLIVTTNNSLGYTLALKATSSPAMQSSSNTVADYQSGAPNTWSVTSGTANFGYAAFGTDVATSTWGTGSTCSTVGDGNAISTTLKYKGFTTSDVTVASRAATTTTSGVATTVCYAVEQNGFYIPSGTYNATIIATGTTL